MNEIASKGISFKTFYNGNLSHNIKLARLQLKSTGVSDIYQCAPHKYGNVRP
jgi:hypothetical protein